MILLTSYTYANPGYTIEDADLIPVTIIEHGKTIDDIIPALSDDIAQTLAVNNGVTIEDIVRWNNLKDTKIRIGDKLIIRK